MPSKASSPPPGWRKVGHVYVSPNEHENQFFPPQIFVEDPKTFVPEPLNEGELPHPWGLKPYEFADLGERMQSMMMNLNGNRQDYDSGGLASPLMQFIEVLEQRKLEQAENLDESVLQQQLVLRISLLECEEDCYRIIKVPAAIKLSVFHDQVLCPVMGWSRAYHGYAFQDSKDGAVIGPGMDVGKYIDLMHASMHYHYIMEDQEIPLAALLSEEGDFCVYTYDLGDSWGHRISVEQVVDARTVGSELNRVVIVEGKGACPPEDGNGLDGSSNGKYAEFLSLYKANPRSSQVKRMVKEVESTAVNYVRPWMGPRLRFKPLDFDMERHQVMLTAMLQGPSVAKKDLCGVITGNDTFEESYKACANCGDRLAALKRCGRCKKVWYCKRECQASHWKSHKKTCKVVK